MGQRVTLNSPWRRDLQALRSVLRTPGPNECRHGTGGFRTATTDRPENISNTLSDWGSVFSSAKAMTELPVQPVLSRLPGLPSAPAILAQGPLERVMVCRDPATGKAVERRPGHASLNLDGQPRCSLPLPRPGTEALTRAPSPSDRNGISGWLAAQIAARSDTPFATIKKRLFASYGGLDHLMRVLAPGELDSYRLLLGRALEAPDESTLKKSNWTVSRSASLVKPAAYWPASASACKARASRSTHSRCSSRRVSCGPGGSALVLARPLSRPCQRTTGATNAWVCIASVYP